MYKVAVRSMSSGSLPQHETIAMPRLTPTMERGRVVKWLKAEGEQIDQGDSVAVVETDKATVDFDSTDNGYLAKILVQEDTEVELGTPVYVIVEEKDDVDAFKDYQPTNVNGAVPAESKEDESSSASTDAAKDTSEETSTSIDSSSSVQSVENPAEERQPGSSSRIFASFLARRLAMEKGVDLTKVQGSGIHGSVVAADVLKAAESQPEAMSDVSSEDLSIEKPKITERDGFSEVEITAIKRAQAERAVESKASVPHFYLTARCDADKMLSLLETWNQESEQQIRPRDVVAKACAVAMEKVPDVNASFQGSTIRQFKDVNISIEVQTVQGSVLPVVRDVGRRGIQAIAVEASRLETGANANNLSDSERSGGTFTLSDLSNFGVKDSVPIVTPSHAACLSMGAFQKGAALDKNNALKATNTMCVTLSCDHRVVDGAVGAQWLKVLKSYIENPTSMLL